MEEQEHRDFIQIIKKPRTVQDYSPHENAIHSSNTSCTVALGIPSHKHEEACTEHILLGLAPIYRPD